MKERTVTIAKIERGIVIDHIPEGKALLISQLLGLNRLARETGDIVAIGINFESPSMKRKDIIKVENLSLTRDMLNVVSLIAPHATITRIYNGSVIEKHKVEIPKRVGDIVICPDRFCITNHEEVPGKFLVVREDPITLRCYYCETEFFGPLIKYKEKELSTR
ncbi:aspartate carbamoyltransferase regulatory subunit [Desulfomonile tiedjei]|uniref:Aspartate carbamoyltransferase regulatory chain n=1 Tax=Desulfomonile tiedjei (strain ATCC 49306 / DSM 6799 / DCB-1) TaxID=706587 RepID=I4C6S2_DESTA|nr:aspartate carbamoyltransferase regulatory subunit [Desulfomonile tiedjei]AFM25263.1 aspartate carbamoyltransferase, regulatory subunit [Desulfomonile tiedjei DSM 6799]